MNRSKLLSKLYGEWGRLLNERNRHTSNLRKPYRKSMTVDALDRRISSINAKIRLNQKLLPKLDERAEHICREMWNEQFLQEALPDQER